MRHAAVGEESVRKIYDDENNLTPKDMKSIGIKFIYDLRNTWVPIR